MTPFSIALLVLFSLLNITLMILMMKTKARTIEKLRPGIVNVDEGNFTGESDNSK